MKSSGIKGFQMYVNVWKYCNMFGYEEVNDFSVFSSPFAFLYFFSETQSGIKPSQFICFAPFCFCEQ